MLVRFSVEDSLGFHLKIVMRVGMKIAIAKKRSEDLNRFPELHKSVEQVSMQPRTVWKNKCFRSFKLNHRKNDLNYTFMNRVISLKN